MKNQAQLITYVDRLGGGDLAQLQDILSHELRGLFGGVHLLPFFDPIDGADAGFDPVDHTVIDPRLGDWDALRRLSTDVEVMADVIVNHVSSDSPQFRDFIARGDASAFAPLFLSPERVFPHGATQAQWDQVVRPRPGRPLSAITLASGAVRELWTTFTPQQIDIDVEHPLGQAYLLSILDALQRGGVTMVRLDAVGYAIKRAGTGCFMLPETFAFIDQLTAQARARGMEVLVEIHSHHRVQIEVAARVDWVYDFALPGLVLHALHFGQAAPLAHWLGMRPHNAITVLDTHDGIGIRDIGADPADRLAHPGLVPPDELDALVERIHEASGGQSRQATGAAASNLDLYQVNCTYYDALGRNDLAYLLARAVQFFVPGVPQVYYVGLLAGHNDMALLAQSGVGRDINRQHFSRADIAAHCTRPVVRALMSLIHLRNTHPAFTGQFTHHLINPTTLSLHWQADTARCSLTVDMASLEYQLLTELDGQRADIRFAL